VPRPRLALGLRRFVGHPGRDHYSRRGTRSGPPRSRAVQADEGSRGSTRPDGTGEVYRAHDARLRAPLQPATGAATLSRSHTPVGDEDRAFELLDKAHDERDSFDALHSDPRWVTLNRKVGVVPSALLSPPR
jgi:hypothetical protein